MVGNKRKKNVVISPEQSASEKKFKDELKTLVNESESVSGRDASAIKASSVELYERISNSCLAPEAKQKLFDKLKMLQEDVDTEDRLEKTCGRFIQIVMLFTTIVPLFITFAGKLSEFAFRPILHTTLDDLSHHTAIISGGCGELGSELAIMLAHSGASVILGCRDVGEPIEDEFVEGFENSNPLDTQVKTDIARRRDIQSRLEAVGLLSQNNEPVRPGHISIWSLDLESFTSVSSFAQKFMSSNSSALDILIHTAATKKGCTITEDGFELSHQVNFLSPALLSQMLLPALGVDTVNRNNPQHGTRNTRIVFTTCDVALQLDDWLPWPMCRVDPKALPRVNMERMEKSLDPLSQCSSLTEYANAKLSSSLYFKELARRLSSRTKVATHMVNPGLMNTRFGSIESTPTNQVSMRAKLMGYMPPVWIGKKLWSFMSAKLNLTKLFLRDVKHGAQMIYHVCAAHALSDMSHSGGIYSDSAGANVNCGKEDWQCSRLTASQLPNTILDRALALELWRNVDEIITQFSAEPHSSYDHNLESKPTQPRRKIIHVEVGDVVEESEAEFQ